MSKRRRRSKGKLIRTRGMALSVKLFKHEGLKMSASKLTKTLKSAMYKPRSKKDIAAGFSKVRTSGKTTLGEFVAGFRVAVLSLDKNGNLTPVHYVSIDRADFIIKMDKGTVEFRGSERVARKFRNLVEEMTGAKLSPLNLDGGTKQLYEAAADISSVLLTGVDKGNLSAAEFKGDGIQTEEEIGLYTRRYKGEISRFRGTFPYPSGAFLTTAVNAEAGSLMVYKSGDGILEKDLSWIVDLMETAALE